MQHTHHPLYEHLLQKKWIVSVVSLLAITIAGICATVGVIEVRSFASAAAPGCSDYTIQMGETLSSIAQEKGVSLQAIEQANPLSDFNVIFPGQHLCIPTQGGPSPSMSLGGGTSSSVESIITQVFGPYAQQAHAVALCESSLNPAATNNSSGAAGLFQILPSTFGGTSQAGRSEYDAYVNTVAAHEIFVRDGYTWREWVCQP